MANAYEQLTKREEAAAEELARAAAAHGRSAISATLGRAATLALRNVGADLGRGAIAEPAADLRAMRTDPDLQAAKRADGARAEADIHEAIVESIAAGYTYDAHERAAIIEAKATGLSLVVSLSDDELAALESFPVVGFTAAEIAARLRAQLEQAIDQTLALPLSGLLNAAALPAALGDLGRLHGERCAGAVREAYFAGSRAAQRAILAALGGVQ